MIELVTKFVSWIKDLINLVLGLPSMFADLTNPFKQVFRFLPGTSEDLIFGFVQLLIVFVLIYFVVKLVVSLL